MQHRSRLALVAGSAALSIALLAGCSSPASTDDAAVEPTPTEQSVADACNALARPLISFGADMQKLETASTEDPQSVVDGFAEAAVELRTASESLSNTEVQSTLDTAIEALDELTVSLQSIIDDPENADFITFEASIERVEADFAAIDTICAG